jgi:thioredoxin 2
MNQEARIVQCKNCGTKNRIPAEKIGMSAKCGKCGSTIETKEKDADLTKSKDGSRSFFLVRCLSCGAKNRIPENKMGETAICGKCRSEVHTAGLLSARSLMITDRDFEEKVLRSPLPVLFFAFANWCPSCRAVIPSVEELAREWKGRVRVAKINVDQNQMTAARYNIMSVPTIIIFDNGQAKDRLTGAVPKLQIVSKMSPYI